MWDSKSYGNEQGGFLNSPSQFASPAEKQDKPARRVQNTVPVTIRQILESSEDGLKIGGMDVHMFTVVALVRRVEVTSTKVSYLLDDCTGGITGVFWLESVDGDDQQCIPPIVENTYCRVYGSVRSNQGKRHVFIFRIMSLTTLDDLTRHILEVMHCNLKIQKMGNERVKETSYSADTTNLSNSFMSTSSINQPGGFSPQQTLVYNAILKSSSDIGAHRDDVVKTFAGKLSPKEIATILDFLCNEGHIYTTIDDDHFRCTDN
ncbi:replication protein A 32 kDa subunit [Periplaneta americana]|uniref:replication protein A 32 kDa subunit n=1 Tax=Periplaneta americana TaxID=6978 RepID=UPI0037E9C550